VVSFMDAAPFSLGSCRHLIRLDRGAEQPPKTPLLCSTNAANAAHVDSSRA